MNCVIALDVGGTSMKAALVDEQRKVIGSARLPTGAGDGPDAVVERIVATVVDQLAAAQRAGHTPKGVGVVVPGIVDEDRGLAVFSANLGWRDAPLVELIEKRVDVPVAFGHDVRAGGLAEGELGAARGVRDYLFLPIGTGIAGAVVLDGQPYSGHGYAGEIGHMIVDPYGPECACGTYGCLEAIASAAAIARRYVARTGQSVETHDLRERLDARDPDAVAVWGEAIEALTRALAAYSTLLGPELVVVGGGLAEAGAVLLDPLSRALDGRLSFQRRPRLVLAELGDQAGALGAGLLAWRRAAVT